MKRLLVNKKITLSGFPNHRSFLSSERTYVLGSSFSCYRHLLIIIFRRISDRDSGRPSDFLSITERSLWRCCNQGVKQLLGKVHVTYELSFRMRPSNFGFLKYHMFWSKMLIKGKLIYNIENCIKYAQNAANKAFNNKAFNNF